MSLASAVHRIHDKTASSVKVVIALSGGGSEAISELLRHGGGSETVLAAHVLYSTESFDKYLGRKPDKYVSEAAARQLAMRAYQEAQELIETQRRSDPGMDNAIPCGIGATSSLIRHANEREGRENLFAVAQQLPNGTTVRTYRFNKNVSVNDAMVEFQELFSRPGQERINGLGILHAVADARLDGDDKVIRDAICPTADPALGMYVTMEEKSARGTRGYGEVLHGKKLYFSPTSEFPRGFVQGDPIAILPGSFNPLHDGHLAMYEYAKKRLRVPVYFELSMSNVDKPPIDYIDATSRVTQFADNGLPLLVTNKPLMRDKVGIFGSNLTLLVGMDTYSRLISPSRYRDGEDELFAILDHFDECDTRFMVFPRGSDTPTNGPHVVGTSAYQRWSHLFTFVPADDFDVNISSTELRLRAR